MITISTSVTTLYESLLVCQHWVALLFVHSSEASGCLTSWSAWFAIVAGMMNVACNCIVVGLHK
jgi:hypothetical protein